jgi:predicted ATP-grasp superfamily ATP-dependent carboligase
MARLINAVGNCAGGGATSFTALPPVIVLNLFHSGLGIVRQLAGTGVRVVGLSADPRIYGNFTRLCEVRNAPNSQEKPRELADFLLRAASDLKGAVIFPTRDADVLFLDKFRAELEPIYCLAIPQRDVLFRVIDKSKLAEIAIEAGLSIPATAVIRDRSDLFSASKKTGFPCVIKPLKSVDWRQGDNWNLIGRRKAFRADSLVELEQHYERVSRAHPEILLQEWVPGATDQIVVWGGHISRHDGLSAFFTARKILQSPEMFGTGCVVKSEELPELAEPSVRLCRALGYDGIAEIEFKRDSRDGKVKLIELNPRHWDWHQLGAASNVNLTWLTYCHLAGLPAKAVTPRFRRTKWVAEDSLLLHALSRLQDGTVTPSQAWRTLAGKRMYGMFAWNDPLPFIRYSLETLAPTIAGAVVRKLRRRASAADGDTNVPTTQQNGFARLKSTK